MKKIAIALLFGLCISTIHAQTAMPFQLNPAGTNTSASTFDDGYGDVGIGTGTALTGRLPGVLSVSNIYSISNGSPPYLISLILNQTATAGSSTAPGQSQYALAIGRLDPTGNSLTTDLLVDQNGLTGIGNGGNLADNSNINAHLYVTDQNGDGYALFAAYTNTNNVGMMIDQKGNVGIGTNTPASTLSIVSPIAYIGTLTNLVNIVNSPISGLGGTGSSPTSTANSLTINRITGTSTFTDFIVSSNGNVGIGTATPGFALEVVGNVGISGGILTGGDAYIGGNSHFNGTTYTSGTASFAGDAYVSANLAAYNFQMTNGSAAGYILQSDASGNASWVPQSSVGAGLWAASGNNIYNLNSGTVTINNGLQLINSTNYTGWSNQISFQNSGGTTRHLIFDDNSPATGTGSSPTSGNLVIVPGYYGNANNTLSIDGAVQIGNPYTSSFTLPSPSTAGGYSLYVQYGILTERVKVALTNGGNWSDYVFDKDYKLPELDQVKEYIAQNHHLPDVPSADDVSCDGIDLGSMDATLLKKIEELTLYVLELKKENQEIKNQMAKK